jgi:hypothetical protein
VQIGLEIAGAFMMVTTEPTMTRDGSVKERGGSSVERLVGRLDAILGLNTLLPGPTTRAVARVTQERHDKDMERRLLAVAAAVECLAGLAFVLFPAIPIALLLDSEPGSTALMIGRVSGVALLALGVACTGAARAVAGSARTWTVIAITLYNAGAGLLLLAFAARDMAQAPLVWIAAVCHLGLGSALATCTFANAAPPVEHSQRAARRV